MYLQNMFNILVASVHLVVPLSSDSCKSIFNDSKTTNDEKSRKHVVFTKFDSTDVTLISKCIRI